MHETVLILHSYLRWLVLAGGILVLFVSVVAWLGHRPWNRVRASILKFWVVAFDIQVLLGLALYLLLSPTAVAARRAGFGAIKNPIIRFWLMEHAATLIIAATLLHLGNVWVRKAKSDVSRHRKLSAVTVVVLALVFSAIPWPGKAPGRPLVRGMAVAGDMAACADPQPAVQRALPARLSDTGLYEDIASKRVSSAAAFYEPRFALWSDGAEKKRWIRLPQGAQIDTTDADAWRFPVGTSIWKEFSLNGKRLETRLLRKIGPGDHDWAQIAYVWNEDETDALAAPAGRLDIRATDHDAPRAAQCSACHGHAKSAILGFSAVQLSHDSPGLTLKKLNIARMLTSPIEDVVIPGTPATVAAVGALHANCAHCHNSLQGSQSRPRCFDPNGPFDFSLRVADTGSVGTLAVARTAIGSLIIPGDPDGSPLVRRMNHRRQWVIGMPPLATEHIDSATIAAVRIWIQELGAAK